MFPLPFPFGVLGSLRGRRLPGDGARRSPSSTSGGPGADAKEGLSRDGTSSPRTGEGASDRCPEGAATLSADPISRSPSLPAVTTTAGHHVACTPPAEPGRGRTRESGVRA